MEISYFKSWIIYVLLMVFLSLFIRIIFSLPVSIFLILMGLSENSVIIFSLIGTTITMVVASFYLFKWVIRLHILPQLNMFDANE